MNEELQKALTEILHGVLTAKGFMLAELPEVIQQLLLWKFWYHSARMAGFIVIIGLIIVLIVKVEKYVLNAEDIDRMDKRFFGWFLVPMLSIIPIVLISGIFFNLTWLQIWLAPKVYLIEYAASLTK